ncbi:MAG TPA: hypothetical protein VG778_08065 [Blastocatellia bacterium]|nr:hypothetical protein [Blastocatellia bacterium]
MKTGEKTVVDPDVSQPEAAELLRKLRDEAFDSSDEKLAIALGREKEEVEAWIREPAKVDADVIIKARGIAQERGVQLD